MKLAKIYFKDDLIIKERYKYIDYIKIKNFCEIDLTDTKKFILIIGWDIAKECGAKSILKNCITNNIFWEFSFNEKKTNFFKRFEYIYNEIFEFHYKKIKKRLVSFDDAINKINDSSKIFINTNNILYIMNNNIFYITNLKEYCFFCLKKIEEIINIFSKHENFFYDKNQVFLKKMLRKYENIENEHVINLLPYLYMCKTK